MVTLKNRLKQMLTFNLVGGTDEEPKSVIFLSRESKELTTEQFNSPEIKTAIEGKDLIITKMD